MVNLFAALFSFFKKNVISQDFKLEGYSYVVAIPFTSCKIWRNGIRLLIQYRGKEWEHNRNERMLELHGMSWEDVQKEENSHLFVVKDYVYGS